MPDQKDREAPLGEALRHAEDGHGRGEHAVAGRPGGLDQEQHAAQADDHPEALPQGQKGPAFEDELSQAAAQGGSFRWWVVMI
ncbi:hypothetical protein D3C87_2045130 [compost metagenome]